MLKPIKFDSTERLFRTKILGFCVALMVIAFGLNAGLLVVSFLEMLSDGISTVTLLAFLSKFPLLAFMTYVFFTMRKAHRMVQETRMGFYVMDLAHDLQTIRDDGKP